ncbi:hypothetical protein [Pleomorphomonas sp. PLEO]|uniref:hypothetical protein n=1 Tax=Pleomorphomonas sp. PLEO TaxID=3239306 RepID=UPI00351E8207
MFDQLAAGAHPFFGNHGNLDDVTYACVELLLEGIRLPLAKTQYAGQPNTPSHGGRYGFNFTIYLGAFFGEHAPSPLENLWVHSILKAMIDRNLRMKTTKENGNEISIKLEISV